jgi:hypothetical protein
MKDLTIKISIVVYSILNLIYCIVFIVFIGGFLMKLYGSLISRLVSKLLT